MQRAGFRATGRPVGRFRAHQGAPFRLRGFERIEMRRPTSCARGLRTVTAWRGWAFLAAFVVVLEALTRAGLLGTYFPPPTQTFAALIAGFADGSLAVAALRTLRTFSEGVALATWSA
jgi:hypothetical protein